MTESLTFIHAADIHIGAPFRGLRALSEEWGRRLAEAIPQAWDRVVDAAIDRNVDFVVVAGDIFDSVRASYRDYSRFFQGLWRLDEQGSPSYLCTGNHDPLSLWQQDFFALPPSATMLAADRPDFALYERDGRPLAMIGGRGYPNKVWSPSESIAAGLTRADGLRFLGKEAQAAPFAVGVLHTGLNLDPVKAPTDPRALRRAGFDYWALGHIHRRTIDNEDDPRVVFSGCIQGRDVRETGPRGVYEVKLIEGRAPQLTFIPTATVVWERLEVDVSACSSIPDLISQVMRESFAANGNDFCEMMVTRITLTGATALHDVLARAGVLEEVRAALNEAYSEFYCDALVDRTRLPLDEAALRSEGLFPAVFLRAADAVRENPAREIDYIQEEFLARNLPMLSSLSEKQVRCLADEATDLVLDLLVQGDGD